MDIDKDKPAGPYSQHVFDHSYKQHLTRCKCKKTKCLRLYCPCFANGQACNASCACAGCGNTLSKNQANRRKAQKLSRRKDAQDRKCTCKKNRCLQRYCVCFLHNQPCGSQCKCKGCANTNGDDDRPQAMHQGRQGTATPESTTPTEEQPAQRQPVPSRTQLTWMTPKKEDMTESYTDPPIHRLCEDNTMQTQNITVQFTSRIERRVQSLATDDQHQMSDEREGVYDFPIRGRDMMLILDGSNNASGLHYATASHAQFQAEVR